MNRDRKGRFQSKSIPKRVIAETRRRVRRVFGPKQSRRRGGK